MFKKYANYGERVNIREALKARRVVGQYIRPTNLHHYSELSRLSGAELFVKHENHQPTGSFKIRGALNFFHHLDITEAPGGVLVSTRGNHGLAMAWAAQWYNTTCTVVVPENNNPELNRIIESFGAELIVHGADFYDAQFYCDELVDQAGYYYVEQGNEPAILNGIGTMALEIFEDLPDVDTIVCPIGGGTGCAALAQVAKTINPAVEIIGVQAEKAPAFYRSWKENHYQVLETADTIADGLAARSCFPLPYMILKDLVDDVVLLSEEDLLEGIRLALSVTHNLAEGAGAAGIMAAVKMKKQLQGKKVVAVMTGGNLETQLLESALRKN